MKEKNRFQKIGLYGVYLGVFLEILNILHIFAGKDAGIFSSVALLVVCISVLLVILGNKKTKNN